MLTVRLPETGVRRQPKPLTVSTVWRECGIDCEDNGEVPIPPGLTQELTGSAPPNDSRTSRLCTPNLRANARRSRPTATLEDPSVRWPGNR